jgi:rod shape-determining protein MreC
MWSLIERAKKVIFALVLSLIPLVLLYVQSKDEDIRSILTWPIVELVGAIHSGTLFVSGFLSDTLYRYVYIVGRGDELVALRAEVLATRALKSRVLDLMNEQASVSELYFRNKENGLPSGELARVIARMGAPMARMVRLDRGSVHGVLPKSPVVAHEGVVGQVLSVAPHFSDVLLVTDASSAIDAKVVGSNARGLLKGITSSTEYLMEIRDIDGLMDVIPGNIVVTSGVNSLFPPGVPIGQVVESFRSRDGLYISARIEPFIIMDRLTYVSILKISDPETTKIESISAAWPLAIQ